MRLSKVITVNFFLTPLAINWATDSNTSCDALFEEEGIWEGGWRGSRVSEGGIADDGSGSGKVDDDGVFVDDDVVLELLVVDGEVSKTNVKWLHVAFTFQTNK